METLSDCIIITEEIEDFVESFFEFESESNV